MKYRTQRGGGLTVVEEPQTEGDAPVMEEGAPEVAKSLILDRFKPVSDAITEDWVPFPDVDPGLDAIGPWVVVQKRLPRKRVGSILTTDDSREMDGWTERVGKLLAIGHTAYRDVNGNPAFGQTEGWPKVGDLVLIPPTGGTEFKRPSKDGRSKDIKVVMLHWRDVFGVAKDVAL